MKTIKSKRLVLQSGRERVYEIDLIELARDNDDRYLVNYRYGWAGQELQEGTRTADPIALQLAEQVFDSLILSRKNHGYSDPSENAAWQTSAVRGIEPSVVADDVRDPRSARLMVLLARLTSLPDKAAAKLIWRTGQVRLFAAAPLLADYCRDAEEVAARVLPYALLRCGRGAPDTAIAGLSLLVERTDMATVVPANIALSLLSSSEAEAVRLRTGLPDAVSEAFANYDDSTVASNKILDFLRLGLAVPGAGEDITDISGAEQQQALVDLFLLSHHDPALRPLFLSVFEQTPFQPFLFRAVRWIFKAAEAADDADVFGVLCHRFDMVPPYVRENYGSYFIPHLQKYVERESMLGKGDGSVAWSDRTRAYFRRRIWRHLRRMGQLGDASYVELATACLIRADEARLPATAKSKWDWNADTGSALLEIHFPAMSRQFAIHNILHGAGTRLTNARGASQIWRFAEDGPSEATQREEPFPQLWDAVPDRVLELLIEANSEQVLAFAGRILKDNHSYCLALPVSVLGSLLTTASDARFTFALDAVRAQFVAGKINGEIVPALFRANRTESVELGKTILNARPDLITANSALSAEMILAVREETKDWQFQFWAENAKQTNAPNVLAEVIDQVGASVWPQEHAVQDKQNVRLAAGLLVENFADAVKEAPLSQLVSLAQSSDIPPQLLAVLLAATRPDGISAFDPNVLARSEDGDLQAAGAELLANADLDQLKKHEDLVAAFLVSPVERARKVSRGAAIAIAEQDDEAAARIASKLLQVLYRAEEFEGVRDDVVETMQGPLLRAVRSHGPDLTWSLLRARSEPARRVGASAVEGFSANDFSLRKTARIGDNDQLRARQWALAALEHRISDIRSAPNEIFSLLDGEWEDSREAAYDLVRRKLHPEDWSPEAVVDLCDCITLPAQRFGREVLGQMFSEEHSEFFLMRLSEHPAAGFRLTIARLIREYAAGDPNRIRKVSPALRTILSRVFTSRAAKEQIYSFIEAEIEAGDAEILGILAELLATVSATCAIADKARVLGHIARLKTKQPDLIPSVRLVAPEVRSAHSGGAY